MNRRIAALTLQILGGLVAIAFLFWGVNAALIRKFKDGQIVADGLGRALEPSPWWARYFLGEESRWPGWKWFIFDLVVGWTLIGICYFLFVSSGRIKENHEKA